MSIDGVLREFDLNSVTHAQLERRLLDREDAVCDLLRLAGQQFGLFPEIVAEVFAEVGLGSPISSEQREMVRNQFTALMDRLREEHERNHGTEQP
jgi:hypothetical protein